MGELRLHLAMTAIEPNKLFTTFVVSRKFPYFLRGFNLDHGTDFSSFVDGVPINFPTHAHGQGYMDLNWVIPELIDYVTFRKGPYYADVGDFSSAGTAAFHLVKTLPEGLAKVGIGQDDYYHVLVAQTPQLGP